MRTINLTNKLADEVADKFEGAFVEESHFDTLIQEDCDVYKPNGDILIKYRKNVLPMQACGVAWAALRNAARKTYNRGAATGAFGDGKKMKQRKQKLDGTISKFTVAHSQVESGIIGYMDRYVRTPYCRMTAFNIDHYKEYTAALPFVYAVNEVFKREAPERYAAQQSMVQRTNEDFYIKGTAFTTITVNRNWRTAVHKDAGDLKEGLGVMAVLEAGKYEGAYLVFPAFRVAVDMRTAGVCLADVHEWHGNTPIIGKGRYERISCIFYYRTNMHLCGTVEEELARAKSRKLGDKLYE